MAVIGVFDSGVGGQSVANALRAAYPDDTIIFVNDHEHMPYGDKTPTEVLDLVIPKMYELISKGSDVIVIACNTVTTNHITELRERFSLPIIGVEPMVEQAAALTQQGTFAVCATPSTLASDRYKDLKNHYAWQKHVIEPDCSQWAYMIENNQVNQSMIREQVGDMCQQGADVIVLGCTHYHWIEDIIKDVANGRAQILQPEQTVITEVAKALSRS